MRRPAPLLLLLLLATASWPRSSHAQAQPKAEPPKNAAICPGITKNFFENEVWEKVVRQKCLTCHQQGGDAEKSDLLLFDLRKTIDAARDNAMAKNREALSKMADKKENDQSRFLQKVIGELDHGGGEILKPDSTGFRILAEFVRQTNGAALSPSVIESSTSIFEGVKMLDDRRLLRRVTLSLAGRLPSESELAAVAKEGHASLPPILDAIMKEDAFYDRLREGFNDIFLTLGVDGNAEQTVLSYEHFEKTRHWYQTFDLTHIKDKDERQRAEWKLAADYRTTLLAEPMKLIEHIVRNDKPFTEIVTADYIMVSPYSSRGYGVYDELKDKFKQPEDPYEYLPVKLKSLVGRGRSEDQESATGFYPHAGLLSTFQYLTRYPTTETNRNRLRARMYYQHFLGVDVLELADRVSDAASVTAKYKVPTMEASQCVVCHKTLDPAAGLFQDFWRFADQGVYGKRKEGWFNDMFPAGFEGEDLPAIDRWRALQWLGERTAKDPRFAVAMTQHVYYILTGRKTLLAPKDFDDPLYSARQYAYLAQRRQTELIAAEFASTGFNLKSVFKAWILSDFYRADGLAAVTTDPCRKTQLEDLGVSRMLAPEQLERKVTAIFGQRWNKLTGDLATLYGGIDSKEVTDRAADPSGAMGAIQRTLSNDVSCFHVARDFARPPAERKLFPGIEPTTKPGASDESDEMIRKTIVQLHEKILGRDDAADSEEVTRTFQLFAAIVKEASAQKEVEPRESYFCRPNRDNPGPEADDSHYTIRAWRGVVTYLLRRPEFLYE